MVVLLLILVLIVFTTRRHKLYKDSTNFINVIKERDTDTHAQRVSERGRG